MALRCTECGTASFSPGTGTTCSCKPGDSAQVTLSPRKPGTSDEDATVAGSPGARLTGDEQLFPKGLPTTDAVERALWANAIAARRLRAAASKLPVEDEYVTSDDGKRGVWRQAWAAEHSRHKARILAVSEERKALVAVAPMTEKRRLADLVKKDNETAKILKGPGQAQRQARDAN
jgi:hypothetical protein